MVVACGGGDVATPTTTPATSTTPAVATTVSSPNDLVAFGRTDVLLSGVVWTMAVADTPVLRAQGLMGVTDLTVDGMLFVFEETVSVSFYMLDTLIPLDIAFFADDGSLVDRFTMTPCEEVRCPTYPAAGPVRYAIETAVGHFDDLDPLILDVATLTTDD